MVVDLVERGEMLWAVECNKKIVGALRYLGNAEWEYMDQDGEQKFDALDYNDAKKWVQDLVKDKPGKSDDSDKPKATVSLTDFAGFFRHQLDGLEILANVSEVQGALSAELMICLASTVAAVESAEGREKLRTDLFALFDSAMQKHLQRRERMAGIGQLLSTLIQQIAEQTSENTEETGDKSEETKDPKPH